MPQITETQDVMLTWNVFNTFFDSPVKCFYRNTHKVDVDFGFPRFLGYIKLNEAGEKFTPKATTFELKNGNTNEVLGTFILDLSDYANILKGKKRYTLMTPV